MKAMLKTTIFLLAVLLCACGTNSSDSRETKISDASEEAFEEAEADHSSVAVIPAVSVTHQVENYEEWIAEFNNNESERSDSGMETIGILAVKDEPGSVVVYMKVSDHESAKGHLSDMDEVEVSHFEILTMPEKDYEQAYRLLVTHRIEDYDRWRPLFDEDEENRQKNGLELVGVARSAEEPTVISVMFACNDVEQAEDFMRSEELKMKMEEAGVIDEPIINWLEAIPDQE